MKRSDLQIAVDQIPGAGALIEGELPPEWAAESLLDAYEARSQVSLKVEARRVNDNVVVQGDGEIALAYQCSRTGVPLTTILRFTFSELYTPAGRNEVNLGAGLDGDALDDGADAPWLITNGVIDAEQLIREQMVLAQEPYPLAPEVDRDTGVDAALPVWTSDQVEVDPRWATLKSIKLD